MTCKIKGFTLIELMITVAVIGILAAIAVPAYDSQKRRGFRSDAVIALTTAAQLQERWRSQTGTYSTDLVAIGSNVTSPKGKYNLVVGNVTAETYTLTASAVGSQAADTDCASFTLTHTGLRSSTNSGGTTTTGFDSRCWPK